MLTLSLFHYIYSCMVNAAFYLSACRPSKDVTPLVQWVPATVTVHSDVYSDFMIFVKLKICEWKPFRVCLHYIFHRYHNRDECWVYFTAHICTHSRHKCHVILTFLQIHCKQWMSVSEPSQAHIFKWAWQHCV